MNASSLSQHIKETASQLGFGLVGICPAATPNGITAFRNWLEAGFDGQMFYLRNREHAYENPQHVLDGVRSIVMLALPYRTEPPAEPSRGFGRVSRYAWNSSDYHDVLHEKLRSLADVVREQSPAARLRGVVDTAPLLERDFARQAGLGWIAKNTMLINKTAGSWFFLAALLTDLELDYDQPHETDHCGTCTACLDACPTQAFPEPYVLDARRCISYLTIELRSEIPVEFRGSMGDWVFGCDVCQEVCPWNRKGIDGDPQIFSAAPGTNPMELGPLFDLSEQEFRQRFRNTPLWRPRRSGILRNAAIVLGNQKSPEAISVLERGCYESDPLVRSACVWAIGRIGGRPAIQALQKLLRDLNLSDAHAEIQATLASVVASEP